ncbi:MAG: iron-containing alcohol dehydrogenase [Firmicutes bacterium]|nr:iron-containing alcohol dehydrogenase [Bacillota bacterium]
MNNFIYENRCELIFGDHPETEIAAAVKRHGGKRVLLCYGSGSVKTSGLFDKIIGELKSAKIAIVEHGGIVANPLLSNALAGVELARHEKVDFVLAIGGGSVIDAAKFIAIGAYKNQDAWKIFRDGVGDDDEDGPYGALPVGAVLTLPAAGSENSTASVVREDKTGQKYATGSEAIRPRFAFVNPRYMFTLPAPQIGYGASDIFAHLLERYMSPQTHVRITDELLVGAMRAMLEIAPKLYQLHTDKSKHTTDEYYQLWAEFCLTGTLAHNSMLSLGRDTQDWATHRMENKLLSGIHNIAHGAGLAIFFPAWMEHVAKTKPHRIEQFCRHVMGTSSTERGIAALRTWYRSIGLALTLSEIGIDPQKVKSDAREIYGPDTKLGGYGMLKIDDILSVIDLAK